MEYKRILPVQDISCVDSALADRRTTYTFGMRTRDKYLPAAVLSNHTGGFEVLLAAT